MARSQAEERANRPRSRQRRASSPARRLLVGAVAAIWILPGIARSEYESKSLDEVSRSGTRTTRESTSLEDAEHATTRSLDSVERSEPRSLDSVTRKQGGDQEVAAAGRADTWSPIPCETFPMTPIADREPANLGEWKALLARWHARITESRSLLDQTTAAYAASLQPGEHLRGSRVTLVRKRAELRRKYNAALCVMPRAVEAAREAGVAPEALRQYE
jgi:hypothetical protein